MNETKPQYHVAKDGQTLGPYTEEAIAQCLREGRLSQVDYVLHPDKMEWVSISDATFLKFNTEPPLPPVAQPPLPVVTGKAKTAGSKTKPWIITLAVIGAIIIVLPIIGVVVLSFVISATNSSIEIARKTIALNDVAQIATAITAYYTEYGRLPSGPETPRRVDGDLLATLTGVQNKDNPRGIVFIEVQAAKKGKSGIANGAFIDPWGGSYKVIYDANYDNQVTLDSHFGSKTIRKTVAVWNDTTEHPDASAKNSAKRQATSWEGN